MQYDITLDIATAQTCQASKWHNKKTTWGDIVATLAQTERTPETVKQYKSYTKQRQGEIKDVGGFVGGYLREGRRRNGYVEYRQIVALDVDYGTTDIWLDFINLNVAGLMYSTHKHTPEEPRLRIVFPLDRQVSPDEYEAIARVVASWLDIDVFDDTTYQPARLMYYPSSSKDGEYLFDSVDAPIACADDILAELPNWEDPTTWPLSSRETEVRKHHKSDKVEDPEEKKGIVGAFCRSYSIEEAIAEFLPDQYSPCEELGDNRYTYVNGSTSGGLVVYNHSLAFSHHATDPAGGKLSNAFDLVRLHRFGDLDEKAKPDTESVKLPSYKAMAEFAGRLSEVKKDIVRQRRSETSDYDEIDKSAREVAFNDDWVADLETDKKGNIRNTINNVVLILHNDEHLKDAFGFNEFEQRETALRALPWDVGVSKYPRPIEDADDAQLRLYLEKAYNITHKGYVTDGLTVCVYSNKYHPVRNYLDALEWDGKERLDNFFIDVFGAADTDYVKAVTRKALVAAVKRIYQPGCKFDYVTVIVGPEGIGKTTTLGLLGGDWFSNSVVKLDDQRALEGIQGAWILELGELAGLRKAETDAVKHFVTKTEDRFRIAYGKRLSYFPRRCVFFGTTNEEDFLRSVTGNRRFWVLNCFGGTPKLDFKKDLTPALIAQIWAEAKERLAQGENVYLDDTLEAEAREIQDRHLEKDDRAGMIAEYLDRKLPKGWDKKDPYERRQWLLDADNQGTEVREVVCILEVWEECLGKNATDISRVDSFALSKILKAFRNWAPQSKPERVKYYGVQKLFVRVILS